MATTTKTLNTVESEVFAGDQMSIAGNEFTLHDRSQPNSSRYPAETQKEESKSNRPVKIKPGPEESEKLQEI